MSLDRQILNRIEKDGIKITPRWFFVLKNFIFSLETLLAIIFGAVSFSLFLEIINRQNNGFNLIKVPYLWLVLVIFFVVVGYWFVTKIDFLYKMKFIPSVTLLFCISISFGYFTFATGKAGKMEFELEKIPAYDALMPSNKEVVPIKEKVENDLNYINFDNENNDNDKTLEKNEELGISEDKNEKDEMKLQKKLNLEVKSDKYVEKDEILEKTLNIDNENDQSEGEVKGISKDVEKEESEKKEEEEVKKEKEETSSNEDDIEAAD